METAEDMSVFHSLKASGGFVFLKNTFLRIQREKNITVTVIEGAKKLKDCAEGPKKRACGPPPGGKTRWT